MDLNILALVLSMSIPIASFKLLMGLPDAFILINSEGQILCANSAACRLLKNNEKLLREKDLSDLTEDKPEKVQQFIIRWSRSGNPLPASLKIHVANGDTIPCHVWGNVIEKGAEGRSDLILLRLKNKAETNSSFAALNDKINQLKKEIYERLMVEQALRKSQVEIVRFNEELERRVEQRTRQIEKTNQELEDSLTQLQQTQEHLVESEKMAFLGGLVAGVAHEINTPIGVGVTAASYLQLEIKKYNKLFNDNALTRTDFESLMSICVESSDMILANLERAASLIQSFKQVAVDQSTNERRSFNLKQYMEEILQSLHPKLKNSAVKFVLDVPDEMEIYNTPGVLYQIITNLLMNSLIHAFDPETEGQVTISAKSSDEQGVQFCYADNGKGISAKNLKKVFEPFFSTNRHQGGTGLGMHIVYNLVTQKLGGKIQCQSEPGKGTEFKIDFPHNND